LFKLVLILIEVQRKANLFRAGIDVPDLVSGGICVNIDKITMMYVDQYMMFFKDLAYPIDPYSEPWCDSSKESFWGNNPTGNLRMQMLARMIKDLTEYLTNEA
jgi:hypothetical protein